MEIIIFGITALIIANVYTDGKYLKLIQTNQKYVKMGGIALGGLMLYILFKKFPDRAKNIISSSNEYMKYLPIDSGTASMVSPILDFTAKQNIFNDSQNSQTYNHPVLNMAATRRRPETFCFSVPIPDSFVSSVILGADFVDYGFLPL